VDKFAAKTMSWATGIQGTKYRSESAREGVYTTVTLGRCFTNALFTVCLMFYWIS